MFGYISEDGCTYYSLLAKYLPVLAHEDGEVLQAAPGRVMEEINVTVKDFDKFLMQELTEFNGEEKKPTKMMFTLMLGCYYFYYYGPH